MTSATLKSIVLIFQQLLSFLANTLNSIRRKNADGRAAEIKQDSVKAFLDKFNPQQQRHHGDKNNDSA